MSAREVLTDAEAGLSLDSRLRLATSIAGVGAWEWDLETNEFLYSEEAKAILGFGLSEPVTYEMVVAATHPDDFPRTLAQSVRARDPAIRDLTPYEYRVITPSGEEKWVYAKGEALFALRDGREKAVRYIGVILDITARKRADEALRRSEARLRLAMEAGKLAVWEAAAGDFPASPELLAVLGFEPGDRPSVEAMTAGFSSRERARVRTEAEAAFARGDRFIETEIQYQPPTGERRWLLLRAELQADAKGELAGGLGVLMDISERKRAEEHIQLLAREIVHRGNNLLAIVQSIVTLSSGEASAELRSQILDRLQSLARTNRLLARSPQETTSLAQLVREEVAPFAGPTSGRVALDGKPVVLGAQSAQALSMALHELSTNAAKYGALSNETGTIAISWTADEGALRLRWKERGGPPLLQPPTRRGFGTTLIERMTAANAGEAARLDWKPEGLACEIRLRLADPAPDAGPHARGRQRKSPSARGRKSDTKMRV